MDLRKANVTLETDRYRVEGAVTLPREGHRSRLSDHFNRRDQEFFTVQDAKVTPLDGSGEPWEAAVLMVGRAHIRVVVPGDA